ncbi:MAG: Phage tail sheath protein FI [uncultured Thiotrichaceae bacterium]|uniref:Phage tail sheath protein FI n=1 Tax=uncultured Thiotrichaceae bacterium TaxID=298394 RepID=A0A6S6SDK3_9GAMM|nr:MAG: Phage tail sheath protein FI [uncultured Thiotrichaceae bacterium]
MPNYLAPGVYVEEVPLGAGPIERVGTSTAAFLGEAPNTKAHLNEAIEVNNWESFKTEFVGSAQKGTLLSQSVYAFFLQGGSRCFVVNIGNSSSAPGDNRLEKGLEQLARIDEIAMVAAAGFTSASDYDALKSHCEAPYAYRVAILDAPKDIPNMRSLTMRAVNSSPTPTSTASDKAEGVGPGESKNGNATCYFPWIVTKDAISGEAIVTPPAGYIAGIWASTDANPGVHKAPANVYIREGNVNYLVTRAEQEVLNQSGINCIRSFDGNIKVWGARTLAPKGSEWRYLNVRRLFNMIEESIARNTEWIVFQPNDHTLWRKIRIQIAAFLTLLWRDGALMGKTEQEAFFVKCDEETNPPEAIDAGQVTAVIGVAPVKPAEFVIFKISQRSAGTDTEAEI